MTGPQPRNLRNIKELLEGKKENKSLVTTRLRQHFHHRQKRIPVGKTGEIPSRTPIIQTEGNRKSLEPWNHAAFQNKTGNDARQNNNHQLPVKVSRKHQTVRLFKSGINSKKVFFWGGVKAARCVQMKRASIRRGEEPRATHTLGCVYPASAPPSPLVAAPQRLF